MISPILYGSVVLGIAVLWLLRKAPKGRTSGFPRNGTIYEHNYYHPHNYPGSISQVYQAVLPMGTTQYYLHGPLNGKKIVLVHGITAPALVFKGIVELLASTGYCVLTYDLYGRGYSEAPECAYGKDLFVSQLDNLVQFLKWDSFLLIGYSLGGAISTAFTARHGEKVKKLVLIAPTGLMSKLPFGAGLITAPVLGELIVFGIGRNLLAAVSQNGYNNPKEAFPKNILAVCDYQIQYHPGFLRSYLSTLRNFPFMSMQKDFEAVGRKKSLPVLCLWGTNDRVVHYEQSAQLLKLIPQAKLVTFEGGSHGFFCELPLDSLAPLLAFLAD